MLKEVISVYLQCGPIRAFHFMPPHLQSVGGAGGWRFCGHSGSFNQLLFKWLTGTPLIEHTLGLDVTLDSVLGQFAAHLRIRCIMVLVTNNRG